MAKPIDVGSLRHRVTLQSVVSTTPEPSPAGVPPQTIAETWESGQSYWAKVEPQRIRRSIGVDTPTSSLWSLVTMRNPGIEIRSGHHRLLLGERVLVIDGVQRLDERNEFLEIECTENPTP